MYCNASHGGGALRARSVTALVATLAMGLLVRPSAAVPFAFVANTTSNSVSVIDTAATPPSVVATVLVGPNPLGVAGTPDGTHAYVANFGSNTVSVLDATTTPPSVVATITVGSAPFGIAFAPDAKHAYVTNSGSNTVSVIDTTTTPRPSLPRSRWG
jgi:YVTN family beta-propeller protein